MESESKKPLVSMILGIASLVLGCSGGGIPLGIAAIIVGSIAKNEGFENSQSKWGRIMGIIGIVISVIACCAGFVLGFMGGISGYSY